MISHSSADGGHVCAHIHWVNCLLYQLYFRWWAGSLANLVNYQDWIHSYVVADIIVSFAVIVSATASYKLTNKALLQVQSGEVNFSYLPVWGRWLRYQQFSSAALLYPIAQGHTSVVSLTFCCCSRVNMSLCLCLWFGHAAVLSQPPTLLCLAAESQQPPPRVSPFSINIPCLSKSDHLKYSENMSSITDEVHFY